MPLLKGSNTWIDRNLSALADSSGIVPQQTITLDTLRRRSKDTKNERIHTAANTKKRQTEESIFSQEII